MPVVSSILHLTPSGASDEYKEKCKQTIDGLLVASELKNSTVRPYVFKRCLSFFWEEKDVSIFWLGEGLPEKDRKEISLFLHQAGFERVRHVSTKVHTESFDTVIGATTNARQINVPSQRREVKPKKQAK